MTDSLEVRRIQVQAQAYAGIVDGLETRMKEVDLGEEEKKELRYAAHTTLSKACFRSGLHLLRRRNVFRGLSQIHRAMREFDRAGISRTGKQY